MMMLLIVLYALFDVALLALAALLGWRYLRTEGRRHDPRVTDWEPYDIDR